MIKLKTETPLPSVPESKKSQAAEATSCEMTQPLWEGNLSFHYSCEEPLLAFSSAFPFFCLAINAFEVCLLP